MGELMEWFVFVAALVFVYVMSRHSNKTTSTRGAAERDHDSDSNPLPHSEAAPNAHRAPSTYLARWAVLYNDIEGAKTERVVRILEVHPRLQNFRVWCELRQAERTLSFWLNGLVCGI